ncbi:hypothetical protein AGMMS50239_39950 [Bacteroidia bacterium]|nr:hypothetical protein AGMMS50239_39950 [Bacteroidia bacterium]GHV29828.1 hypothetical protein FACS1894177_01360 [Bacteroidia bacterium]
MLEIEKYKDDLLLLLDENKAVRRFYIFGSALTPRFNKDISDIDILLETRELPPEEKGEMLISLWDNLEKLFGRKVDLLTENSLKNPFLINEINKTRKLIYDEQNRQIFI